MRKSVTISIVIATIILGAIAIFTALKIRDFEEKPIAPNVPSSKPQAVLSDKICQAPFSVVLITGPKCIGITSNPTSTTINNANEKRVLTVTSSGGDGLVSYSWSVSSNKAGVGNFSSTSGATVTWTSPPSPSANQSWTIIATARDEKGNVDSRNCEIVFYYKTAPTGTPTPTASATPTLTPGPSITPSPTPTGSPTHRECNANRQCVVVAGPGGDSCTSDVSCQPLSTPVPIPPVGSDIPTFGLIIGGGLLLVLGLSLLIL